MNSLEDLKIHILINGLKNKIINNAEFIIRVLNDTYNTSYDTHEKQLTAIADSIEEIESILKELSKII